MKQTAVEWLGNELVKKGFPIEKYGMDLLEQAKEIEKQHIVDAFVECWKENMPDGFECKLSAEEYYSKTFKKD